MDRSNLIHRACLLVFALTLFGCQSQTHPWIGEQYREPSVYTNPPQSIYAPMPTIPPELDAKDITGDQSQDAEMEATLMDLTLMDL